MCIDLSFNTPLGRAREVYYDENYDGLCSLDTHDEDFS
jgi:hypothetical protein